MSSTATVHNPSNFEPANYCVEDYLDNKRPEYCGQPVEAWKAEIEAWEGDMARTFGPDWRRKIHRCVHCGNGNVRYITAVSYLPTGERVVFGADCTERLGFADRHAWKLAVLKSKAEAGHARLKVYRQREAFLQAHPEVAAAIEQAKAEVHARNSFVHDVLGKLNVFGSLSEAQVSAVLASLQRDVERAARATVEAAEVKGPAPSGRVTVTGTVVGLKTQESAFGTVHKMLIKLANNSKGWVTQPAGAQVERGGVVTLAATWEVSRDDPSFAFGKRPHLVSYTPPA